MLALTYGLLAGFGPLLNGSWDLWAQTFLFLGALPAASAWLLAHIVSGRVAAPNATLRVWVAVLLALSAVSTATSPVRALARPEWAVFLGGLWILFAAPLVSASQKRWVDRGIHAAAWFQALLVLYQSVFFPDHAVGTLLKENALAAFFLMLLPFAWYRRDYALAGLMALLLFKTRSVGAFGALLVFGALHSWRRDARGRAAFLLALGALLAAFKLNDPAIVDRLAWWRAAGLMLADRPFLGVGPGAFTWLYPAYGSGHLGSQFAHQYPLQTAAEFGLPFASLWFGGVLRLMRGRGMRGPRQASALLVLLHSCVDIGLNIPGLFWLWCYFLSDGVAEERRWYQLEGGTKALAFVFAVCFSVVLVRGVWSPWRAQVACVEPTARSLARAEALAPDHPLVQREWARLEWDDAARTGSRYGMLRALARQEKAAELDPYHRETWLRLASWYRAFGRPDLAAGAEFRRDLVFRRRL